jgi:hypothetical protein
MLKKREEQKLSQQMLEREDRRYSGVDSGLKVNK